MARENYIMRSLIICAFLQVRIMIMFISRRMMLTKCVACMEEMRNAYSLMEGNKGSKHWRI
jgi:hypothetical protein